MGINCQMIEKPKKRLMFRNIKRSFTTACKRAGIPYGRKTENGITFHDLRRTCKTYMLEADARKTYRDLVTCHALQGI